MKTTKETPSEAVLISWVSVNNHAAPLLPAIRDRDRVLGAPVKTLHLCFRQTATGNDNRENSALVSTIDTLRSELKPHCPKIIQEPWKTSTAPTDHAEIRKFAEAMLTKVRQKHPDSLLVIHLSPGTPAMHAVWLALGTTGFVTGPIKLIQTTDVRGLASGKASVQVVQFKLDTILQRYLRTKPYHREAPDDVQVWNPATVKSKALREAMEKLHKWAPMRTPVLLTGERGTGKTSLANYLRAVSPFQKDTVSDWPTVVCGQFRTNPELARSELFGHVRGAFTGATDDREGLLEMADGETVFFDEIADIDRDTQRLLIAALEGRGFRRLGDMTLKKPTFRLVCATNRSLAELRSECLDPDFYDRLAVFILTIPALRECADDLPNAWAQVLAQATITSNVQPAGWQRFRSNSDLVERIKSHPLPGNFRDLQRAACHLLAELQAGSSDDVIVQAAINALDGVVGDKGTSKSFTPQFPVEFNTLLTEYRLKWYEAALNQSSGNKTEAARLLGIPRKTLENHLNKLAQER